MSRIQRLQNPTLILITLVYVSETAPVQKQMYTAQTGRRTTARVALQIGRPTHDEMSMAVKRRNMFEYVHTQSARLFHLRTVSSASGITDEANTCGKLELVTNKRSGQRDAVSVHNSS